MKKYFIRKVRIYLLSFVFLNLISFINPVENKTQIVQKDPVTNLSLELFLGYGFPINASYIDTYKNDDIYWNPNSGITADIRFTLKLSDFIYLSLPIAGSFGIYQYTTTDGRKINTEAKAKRTPTTTNTEWAFSHDFVPLVYIKPGTHPAIPYIALGVGVSFLWSFEAWEFTNVNDKKVKLEMVKYHLPEPSFKGEIGWIIPLNKILSFRVAGFFNLVNSVMIRVELTHYYINNKDHISEYDEKSRIYSYAYNVPDENKGGDCLLAGFTYENYPQNKIGTNAGLKLGLARNFRR